MGFSKISIGAILAFHRIVEAHDCNGAGNPYLQICAACLEDFVRKFQEEGTELISLEELAARLSQRPKSGRRFVSLTFDDGYQDTFTIAYPILKRLKVPFAVFLVAGFLDGRASMWWRILEVLIAERDEIEFIWESRRRVYRAKTVAEKRRAFGMIKALIKAASPDRLEELQSALFPSSMVDSGRLTRAMVLEEGQIAAMSQDPLVTFGSHTVRHLPLSRLDRGTAARELSESKAALEARLGRPVEHAAFPYGDRDACGPREWGLAAEAGYKTAVTTYGHDVSMGDSLHGLPRRCVWEDGKHRLHLG